MSDDTCSCRRTSSKGGRLSASTSQHCTMRDLKPLGMFSGMLGLKPISTLKNTCLQIQIQVKPFAFLKQAIRTALIMPPADGVQSSYPIMKNL